MPEATVAKISQAAAESTTSNHTLITNLYAVCGTWDDSNSARV